jgi:hypothetical protein
VIPVLQRAARTARKASTGEKLVDIVLTEEGFVIRGTVQTRRGDRRYSLDLAWPEFDARPDLLVNSVVLVERELGRLERQGS